MISGFNFFILFSLAIALVQCRVYETENAVVIEVDRKPASLAISEFSDGNSDAETHSIDTNKPHQLITSQSDRSCLTIDRSPGTCVSARQCYPYNLPHYPILLHPTPYQTAFLFPSWILGTRGSCSYVEPDGKLFYGVCCRTGLSNPSTTATSNKKNGEMATNQARVVNGEPTNKGEFPFMVGIEINGKFQCGGSLLDDKHVLTSASCIDSIKTGDDLAKLKLFMGVANLNDEDRVNRKAYSIIKHKGFDSKTMHNDIALIKMMTPVEKSSRISPVCFDERKYDQAGFYAVAIGWGELSYGAGSNPNTLQKVTLQVKSNEDCRKNWVGKAPGGITDHMICAFSPKKDACRGDDGGPLLVNSCQVGIVSFGKGCATDYYGVYTRIASFQEWITFNMKRA